MLKLAQWTTAETIGCLQITGVLYSKGVSPPDSQCNDLSPLRSTGQSGHCRVTSGSSRATSPARMRSGSVACCRSNSSSATLSIGPAFERTAQPAREDMPARCNQAGHQPARVAARRARPHAGGSRAVAAGQSVASADARSNCWPRSATAMSSITMHSPAGSLVTRCGAMMARRLPLEVCERRLRGCERLG